MTFLPGHLVRVFDEETSRVVVGVVVGDGVAPLQGISSLGQLLSEDLDTIERVMTDRGPILPSRRLRALPPIDGATEIWAAGVTYQVSREARVEDSDASDVYHKVYDAERPELFFKAQSWRVVTDNEPIAVREDSPNNVPEPEVGLVLNRHGELVGFTMVDDVSSRSIEGENPLYLPQAKIFDGCCAIGPSVAPRQSVGDGQSMSIRMTIRRDGKKVFEGESSTAQMRRDFSELSRYLACQLTFPEGAVLATGTGVVPDLAMTLKIGDQVDIEIDNLGSFSTSVASAREVGEWLERRRSNPGLTFASVGPVEQGAGDYGQN